MGVVPIGEPRLPGGGGTWWIAVGPVDRSLPLGIGDQAGHRPGRAGGRRGGIARAGRAGRSRGLDGPPPAGPRLRARPRPRPAAGPTRDPPDLLERRLPACWPGWWPSGPGMPFADYLRDGVLGPLGMAGTAMLDSEHRAGRSGGRTVRVPCPTCWRWARELAAPTLISAETHREAGLGPVRRPGRGAPRLRAVRSLRLGPRGWRSAATSSPTGPGPPTRRPPSATSAVGLVPVGRSGGRRPLLPGWPTARSGCGRPGRGRCWPTPCWPRRRPGTVRDRA